MGLDDAIHAARQSADSRDNRLRQQAERERREQQEAEDLAGEALERLRLYEADRFVRVKKGGFFG